MTEPLPLCKVCGHPEVGHYPPDPHERPRVLRCRYCPKNICQAPWRQT